ncbi:hypothetical protein BH23ACT6_BH23ACT6_20680 [soil metagenome]
MIVADASWVIALRDPSDPHHQAAVELNDATRDEEVVLHPVTFAETLVGPAKMGALSQAAAGARAAYEIIAVDGEAPLRWANLRATTTLRLPDAIVLDTAITHAAVMILTFDRGLAAAAQANSISAPANATQIARS